MRQIEKVYEGKDGKCCCGCSGRYSYNPEDFQPALEKVLAHPGHEFEHNHVFTVIRKRLHIVYFKAEEAK